MRKSFRIIIFLLLTLFIISEKSASADAPVQVALINPLQVVNEIDNVKGVRFNLVYGVNYDVTGIDLGLINKTDGAQKGFQMGIYNSTFEVSGVQLGLINKTEWLDGLQIGLINIAVEEDRKFFPIVNFSF